MRNGRIPWTILCLALVPLVAGSAEAKKVGPTRLEVAQVEPVEELLLDVGIQLFDPGLPPNDEHALEEEGVFPDVRKAEARFVPVHLMDTLQSTGFWGAVRVVPDASIHVDLLVTGKILQSSGLEMELELEAQDARGEVWLKKKTYKAEAEVRAYRDDAVEDPFQHLYNYLANELLEALGKRKEDELLALRQISRLKFAADVAPAVFEDYLDRDRKGRRVIRRLPAEGDPMVERVTAIRQRDYLFIDTLTDHYTGFQAQMMEPYHSWRQFSYEEEKAMKELKRKARNRKILGAVAIAAGIFAGGDSRSSDAARDLAIYGGVQAIYSGIAKGQEAKLHRESLRELAVSFDAEVSPALVEVEGRTLKLSGSVETQFKEWRRLLRQIFAEETGVLADPDENLADGGSATVDEIPSAVETTPHLPDGDDSELP